MCDPVTAAIVIGVTTAATQVGGAIAQGKAARAQEKAINASLTRTREETRRAATGEMFEADRAARREQGRIKTAAGEAGLSLASGSIEGLLMDSAMQLELANDNTLANMESRHASAVADAESAMSSVQKPTVLGVGLQLAGTAASTMSGVGTAKIQMANTSQAAAASAGAGA